MSMSSKGAALSTLRRWFGGIARECRIRGGTRHLMAMDDGMLRDIGLTRGDVEYAVRYGRVRNA